MTPIPVRTRCSCPNWGSSLLLLPNQLKQLLINQLYIYSWICPEPGTVQPQSVYLFFDSLRRLNYLPNIWYNSYSMAAHNDDDDVNASPWEQYLTLSHCLLQSSNFAFHFTYLYLPPVKSGYLVFHQKSCQDCSCALLSCCQNSFHKGHIWHIFFVPVDDDIEDNQREDGDPDVEYCVHPDEIYVQIPEVVPIWKKIEVMLF